MPLTLMVVTPRRIVLTFGRVVSVVITRKLRLGLVLPLFRRELVVLPVSISTLVVMKPWLNWITRGNVPGGRIFPPGSLNRVGTEGPPLLLRPSLLPPRGRVPNF